MWSEEGTIKLFLHGMNIIEGIYRSIQGIPYYTFRLYLEQHIACRAMMNKQQKINASTRKNDAIKRRSN
jgi:hypothetical protein